MRLKINFQGIARKEHIPINYNYPISAWIYHLLYQSSPEYADFLHDRGYMGVDGKPRKLFTFSRLQISPRADRRRDRLVVGPEHSIHLFLSSPMIDDFIQHLVVGLFQEQTLDLVGGGAKARLVVKSVEAYPAPEFVSPMRFLSLSPIVVTTARDRNGKKAKHYFRPNEPELSEAVRLSLIKKYETQYNAPPQDNSFEFKADCHYIERKGGPERTMTLVRLKQDQRDYTDVKGFLVPITLAGSIELMETAWECGIGDKTSMGFGCVGVMDKK